MKKFRSITRAIKRGHVKVVPLTQPVFNKELDKTELQETTILMRKSSNGKWIRF